jgi:hypothetical protein
MFQSQVEVAWEPSFWFLFWKQNNWENLTEEGETSTQFGIQGEDKEHKRMIYLDKKA